MWILTLRSALGQPYEHMLRTGRTTIGRSPESDIVISDESASRLHAEIYLSADAETPAIRDLDSTNGTFVNRERLTLPYTLRPGDQIRIGKYVAKLSFRDDRGTPRHTAILSTQPFTRDLLLESVDQHALTLYEAASRLNSIVDLDAALQEVAQLLRVALNAEKCGVVLDEHFGQLDEFGIPASVAERAIGQRSIVVIPDLAAQSDHTVGQSARSPQIRSILCVPVLAEKEVVGLVYVYRVDSASQAFDERDVRLAVAISHQTALTIQRARLLRQAREALQESEARYRAIVEDQTEMICRFLPDGTLTFVNGAYCRYFGKTARELVGAKFKPQIPPEDAHFVTLKRKAISPEHPTARYWHRVLTAGEEIRWQEWTDRALYDDRGRLIEFQSVGQDITERKLAETALKQRNQELAEIELLRRLDRLRSELIANVSHELRTPLGLITVLCTTLLREDVSVDPSTQREFLLDIKEEADRLAQIVGNLLDMSRLQHGRLRLDKQPLNLEQMAREMIESIQPRLARHRLVNRISPAPLVAIADAGRVEQVLRNLLENAVKYSPDGGDITIGARQVENELLIEICDQGIGIPGHDLERIFESFYRVENESTQRVGGVGLGLAICREIVTAHGGRIWAESTPGAGSTFYFTLPIGRQT